MLMLMFISSCKNNEANLSSKELYHDGVSFESNEDNSDDNDITAILQFRGTYDELNAEYPITCVIDNDGFRRVVYANSKEAAVIYFDKNMNWIFSKRFSRSNLKSTQIEQSNVHTLKDVISLDPDGDYTFLYTGRNDTPKVSTHFTSDDYMVEITYGESNTIIKSTKNKL